MIPTALPSAHVEQQLEAALAEATRTDCPPKLAEALHYAVFPGGARVRPKLCLAVAAASGAEDLRLAARAAAAVELLHCASLVHDDLPCFDDAALRRGRASLHRRFGEPMAVLVGDALIVTAFRVMADADAEHAWALPALVRIVADSVGASGGICAGQAWECESDVELDAYHQAKTGALFAAATAAGAVAAGASAQGWAEVGLRLGEAFQVADDLRDFAGVVAEIGKPAGQDAALGRPNAARELGLEGACQHLCALIEATVDSLPQCGGRPWLSELIRHESRSFLPPRLAAEVARHAA